MKKIIFVSLLIIFIQQIASASNVLPSNESFYRESETTQTTINEELEQSNFSNIQTELKSQNKPKDKPKAKGLTNYQYDESNYHYYKIKNYIQDNIDYSQSGRLKY